MLIATLVVEAETEIARRVMEDVQAAGAVAPPHLMFEVANALVMKRRRKLIDTPYRDAAVETFIRYEIGVDDHHDRAAVARRSVELSDRHGLTIYDAAYLELARRAGLILATLDADLRKAASREDVPVAP